MRRKGRGREGERNKRRAARGLDDGQEERVTMARVEGGGCKKRGKRGAAKEPHRRQHKGTLARAMAQRHQEGTLAPCTVLQWGK